MSRNLVFCPIPFAITEVPLGSLTTDILRPHRYNTIIKPVTSDDWQIRDQAAYDGVIKYDVARGFFAQITRMLHLSRDTSSNVSVHVTSHQGKEHFLKEPEKFWENMTTDETTKDTVMKFLSGIYKQGDGWLVTAVRTFLDASVEVETGKGTEWRIEAKVPAGKVAKVASGMQAGDVGNIGGGVTRTWKEGTYETFRLDGERIFSIEFRKIVVEKCKRGFSGEVPKGKTVLRILPDFRGGGDFGADVTSEEIYTVGLESQGETLQDYDDELGELEESGKVDIFSDGGNGDVVYIDPKWVEYNDVSESLVEDSGAGLDHTDLMRQDM